MSKIKKLESLLTQGKISRRDFLTRVSALGLATALSPAFLSSPLQAATPKKGGRLRLAWHAFSISDTLDPTVTSTMAANLVQLQLSNGLIEVGPGGVLVPELAESWESTPDVKKWIFKLRKDVEFHSGKKFTAEDVVHTYNLHRAEGSKSQVKSFLKGIVDIKADGKHTVIFTLEEGNVGFPSIAAAIQLAMLPAGVNTFKDGDGTGGYHLQHYNPGVSALTKRNPNYWKEGRAHFDEVEIVGIADVNARMNALRTDQIDVMNQCDLKTVHFLEKDPKVQVIRVTAKQYRNLAMRTDMAPYDNNDVRLALKYAIDREDIVKRALSGYGTLGNDHPISSGYQFYADELPQRAYDPDKARFHLKKSKMEDAVFVVHASDAAYAGAVDVALLYQQHASKAGIKIEVKKEPADGYWSNVWMKKPLCASTWSGRINEDVMFSTAYAGGAPWNESYWKNDRFDTLLNQARKELDEAKRRDMYVEMQRIVRDEGGSVIPVYADFVFAASAKVKFGELASNWTLDGIKAPERWWFDS